MSKKKNPKIMAPDSKEMPPKKPPLTEEQLAALAEYREKMKAVRQQYAKETSHIPTKAQAKELKKKQLKSERDSSWEAYLSDLRPKLAKIPPGITSIRKSLISLERKPPPIVKDEEARSKGIENFVAAREKVVLEKRKKVLDWYRELLPRVIPPEEIDAAIRQANENPKNPNVPIGVLIAQSIEKKKRIAGLRPHTQNLPQSAVIVQPNRDY
jgi:hypothetical protein